MQFNCLMQKGESTPTLKLSLLFSALLFLGVFSGVMIATFLNLSSKQAIFSDISVFVYAGHTQTTFWQSLWQISWIPLLILCLSFTCFGPVAIPAAVLLQGYLLSFSISAMVRLLGWKGCLLGLANFGIRTSVIIPCLLILSVQCFLLSKQFLMIMRPSADRGVKLPRGFVFSVVCSLILLLIGAALDVWLTDRAVTSVLNHFIF